ncbi:hypothetical protein GCM10028857_13830 [Salinarchaeum chitinilyticum]
MSLDDAVRDSARSLGARPAQVLPFYVAGLAVPVIVRVVPFLGLLLAYLSLRGSGRLEAVREELEPAAPISIDDVGSGTAEGRSIDEDALGEAMLDLLTPTVIAILAVTALVSLVLFAVMQSSVAAARLHAVFAVLTEDDSDSPTSPTRAGIDGVFEHTWTFLGLFILEFLALLLLFGIPTALIAIAVVADFVWLVIPAIPLFFFAIPAALLVRLLFAFARPAAVVDGVGAISAVKRAIGHVKANVLESVGYGALALGLVMVANSIGTAFSQFGAVTVSTLVPLVFVFPLLDLAKTSLYAQNAGVALTSPNQPDRGRIERLRGGIERGWSALVAFTRGHLGSVAISTVVLAAGVAVGLWAGAQVDDLFTASIEARIDRMNPLAAFFHYAGNNWSVAAGQSLAGIAVGLPTIVSLAFNGANVGFLYQLEADPTILLAFIVPHGIIEIPALLLSGALGLHLGRVGWGYAFGDVDRDRVADAIDRAFQVLVGLAVLFVAAAVIEAFVSPYYWRVLGI